MTFTCTCLPTRTYVMHGPMCNREFPFAQYSPGRAYARMQRAYDKHMLSDDEVGNRRAVGDDLQISWASGRMQKECVRFTCVRERERERQASMCNN